MYKALAFNKFITYQKLLEEEKIANCANHDEDHKILPRAGLDIPKNEISFLRRQVVDLQSCCILLSTYISEVRNSISFSIK